MGWSVPCRLLQLHTLSCGILAVYSTKRCPEILLRSFVVVSIVLQQFTKPPSHQHSIQSFTMSARRISILYTLSQSSPSLRIESDTAKFVECLVC